jgi:hypothetical protein
MVRLLMRLSDALYAIGFDGLAHHVMGMALRRT